VNIQRLEDGFGQQPAQTGDPSQSYPVLSNAARESIAIKRLSRASSLQRKKLQVALSFLERPMQSSFALSIRASP